MKEIPLQGGRTTPGIVRIGQTVRRPPTSNSNFVQRLLQHLAARGFQGTPVPLGTDELGRDILSFVEGEVPGELSVHDDDVLRAAATLIRRFHDLGAELVAATAAQAVGIEVVCHNDLSPCNFVFRSRLPVAIIDFDASALGTRAQDLGYAVWLWLDLGSADIGAAEQRRRLHLFLDAYEPGSCDVEVVLAAVVQRQTILIAQGQRSGDPAMSRWAENCRKWTHQNRKILSAA